MKAPQAQPKSKRTTAKSKPRSASTTTRTSPLGGYHPAFRRFPPHDKPLGECVPINHPRGKDGGWGH